MRLFDLGGLSIWELTRRVWAELIDDNVTDAAAQLGYYFMLAMFPLLIFLLSSVALVSNADLVAPLLATLHRIMPGQAFDLMRREVDRILAASNGGLVTFGMLGTIWAASSGVASLVGTLNRAYDAVETRSFLKIRAISVGLTFALVLLLVAGSTLLVTGRSIADHVARLFGVEWLGTVAGGGLNYVVGFVILCVAIELVYYFGPNVRDRRWTWISPGSLVSTALFTLGSFGFSIYVRFSDAYSITYGSIGAVIVLLLWLYIFGLAIVVGAEVNAEIRNAAARGPEREAARA